MTWQDKLRHLDEELAAGRLSAEEYRHLRDALLASQDQPGSVPPAEQPPAGSPFPPPFKWDNGGDFTEVMRPAGRGGPAKATPEPGDDAERTQVVGGRPEVDDDRTQSIPGRGRVAPGPQFGGQFPQQMPPQQLPPRPADYGQAVPPWQALGGQPGNVPGGEPDLPPQTDLPPAWLRQGPDEFETDRGSKASRIIAIAVAALVVVGLTVGAYLLFGSNGGSQGTPPQTSSGTPASRSTPSPTTTQPPPPPIVQPGGAVQMDSTLTPQQLKDFLGPQDFEILSSNRVGETQAIVTKQGPLTLGTWAFTVPGQAAGEQVLSQIEALYTSVGFKPVAKVTAPNVSAISLVEPDKTTYRAHYLADGKVIRIESYGQDAAQAEAEFYKLLQAQLERLPAEG